MIAGRFWTLKRRWLLTLLLSFTGLSLLTLGCNGLRVDGYPEDFQYPARTSPLIVDNETPVLKKTVTAYPPLGIMPQQQFHELAEKADDFIHDVSKVPADQRERLDKALRDLFGTPAKPLVIPYLNAESGKPSRAGTDAGEKSTQALADLFGTDDNHLAIHLNGDKRRVWHEVERVILPNGSKLYRRHCLHCHGVTGNGRGPTAPWVKPHPRDYRKGKFKFTSSLPTQKPLREDLYRTLHDGLEGSSMPPFKHLTSQELNELVSYVIHLSIRGEVEYLTLKDLVLASDANAPNVQKQVASHLGRVIRSWQSATPVTVLPYAETDVGKVIEPLEASIDQLRQTMAASEKTVQESEDEMEKLSAQQAKAQALAELEVAESKKTEALKQSVSRGYKLFLANCRQCHNNFGRTTNFKLDTWGTIVQPRDLTKGIYRGGRRPIDLYYRIVSGINPSQMPGVYKAEVGASTNETDVWALKQPKAGEAPDASGTVDPSRVWDLVNFVRVLPYPHMLPDDVREKVYGKTDD